MFRAGSGPGSCRARLRRAPRPTFVIGAESELVGVAVGAQRGSRQLIVLAVLPRVGFDRIRLLAVASGHLLAAAVGSGSSSSPAGGRSARRRRAPLVAGWLMRWRRFHASISSGSKRSGRARSCRPDRTEFASVVAHRVLTHRDRRPLGGRHQCDWRCSLSRFFRRAAARHTVRPKGQRGASTFESDRASGLGRVLLQVVLLAGVEEAGQWVETSCARAARPSTAVLRPARPAPLVATAWAAIATQPPVGEQSLQPDRHVARQPSRRARSAAGRWPIGTGPGSPARRVAVSHEESVLLVVRPSVGADNAAGGRFLEPVARYRSRCVRPSSTFAGIATGPACKRAAPLKERI